MTSINSKLQLALLNRKKGRNLIEKGFTLVELMIVIVIVGILSAVALPNFLSQTSKARATEAQSQISAAFKNATALYLEDPKVTTDIGGATAIDRDTTPTSDIGTCGAELKLATSDSVVGYECSFDSPDLAIVGFVTGGGTVLGAIDVSTGEVAEKPSFEEAAQEG